MAEKLIDSDELMQPLDQWANEMRETWKSNVRMSFFLAGMVQKVEEICESLPDASEPILAELKSTRARVKHLEAEKVELVEAVEIGHKACFSCACTASFRGDAIEEDRWDERTKKLKALLEKHREAGE